MWLVQFQTLIGTVKGVQALEEILLTLYAFQTLIGTVKGPGEPEGPPLAVLFQTLIGTVKGPVPCPGSGPCPGPGVDREPRGRGGHHAGPGGVGSGQVSNPHRYGQRAAPAYSLADLNAASFKPS